MDGWSEINVRKGGAGKEADKSAHVKFLDPPLYVVSYQTAGVVGTRHTHIYRPTCQSNNSSTKSQVSQSYSAAKTLMRVNICHSGMWIW